MKNKIFTTIISICMLAVTVSLSGCNNNEQNTVLPNADNLLASVQKSSNSPQYDFITSAKQPEEYSTYINKSTELGLKMLKSENYDKENTAVAPLSVSLSLSAMANSTAKDTLRQIKNFVGTANLNMDTINQCSAYISQRIRFFNKDGNGVFDTATVWVGNNMTVKRSFLQKYDNFYNMSFYQMNFADNTTNSLIKEYIASQSENLLPVGDIHTTGKYRLYNDCSVAVSDYWLTPYTNSESGKFVTDENKSVNVSYLTSVERIYKSDKATAFIKEFKNIPCKLLCILPNENITLQEYVDSLSYDKLLDIPNKIKPMEFAVVSIPQFSVEKSASLKDALSNIGISNIFSENADFSKGFNENLFLDDMTQSVKIAISENGVFRTQKDDEVTDTETSETKEKIIFDRPFLYAVIDNESYVPVILGTVNQPKN